MTTAALYPISRKAVPISCQGSAPLPGTRRLFSPVWKWPTNGPVVRDRFAEAVLLDIHMEGVEHHLDVGLADLANEGHPLVGGVQDVVLKSVEHFQTEINIEI